MSLLATVLVIVLVARIIGQIAELCGQPRVVGELLAGIMLGPSLLGHVWPGAGEWVATGTSHLDGLADLGLVLFMFFVGLDLDLGELRGHGRKVVLISHGSIAVPMVLGCLVGTWLYAQLDPPTGRLGFVLFMGVAMSITAFPVLARILEETGLAQTRPGNLTVACAAIDDVTAWCLLAFVVTVAGRGGIAGVIVTLGSTVLFAATMWTGVRVLLARWPRAPLSFLIVLALASAWTTEQIGIHAVFGAFAAGAIWRHRPGITWRWERPLRLLVTTLLLPIYFATIGVVTRFGSLDSLGLWAMCGLVILTAVTAKFGGAVLAARLTGERWATAVLIGVLMNTRGLTEIVILTVGLQAGILTTTLFTMMVIMALATTLMAPPCIRRILRRQPSFASAA